MLSQEMSMEDKILELLFKETHKYKGVAISALGLPALFLKKKQSTSNAFYKLKKQGYISREKDKIILLPRGKKYIENKKARLVTFSSPFKNEASKDLLVMFDIPEEKKSERGWFRFQLRQFGYKMIQRSVWVGPSPLPKEFLDYVKSLKLKDCIKTFKLAKPYHTQN